MGIVMQIISRDEVAWEGPSTSGNLSLFPDKKERKEATLDDNRWEGWGVERGLQ